MCLWAPPTPGPIGNTERIEVAWCIKDGYGSRLIPEVCFKNDVDSEEKVERATDISLSIFSFSPLGNFHCGSVRQDQHLCPVHCCWRFY